MDVGGTSIRAGVVDERGSLLDTARVATPSEEGALEDAIAGVVEDLRNRHEVAGVGLAVAGFVARDRRSVMFAPHLAWRGAPVADRIEKRVGLPVLLEHDVNSAIVGEHRFGAARGAQVAALVALGTGIGAGLLLDGKLFRGAYGVAPELGHLTVVRGGRPCPCGKYGCWERYCSGTALASTAVELLARHPGRSTVLAPQVAGDPGSVTGRRV
ncbi:ROK family protein, partial [Amycolatopsis sp. NPDC051114]